MQQGQAIAVGGALLDALRSTGGASSGARQSPGQHYGTGTKLGAQLPFSRNQELEADKIGLTFMAKAGYDPREAIGLWKRIAAYHRKKGGQGAEFLRTHPLDDTRTEALEQFLPVALKYYRP